VLNFKPIRDESFGWCALTTATEYAVEDETPPLAAQPASRSWSKKMHRRASNGTKWCTKKQMVLALVTENDYFEPPKSHCRARWKFRQEAFEDYVT
jgi:hypothetical protein